MLATILHYELCWEEKSSREINIGSLHVGLQSSLELMAEKAFLLVAYTVLQMPRKGGRLSYKEASFAFRIIYTVWLLWSTLSTCRLLLDRRMQPRLLHFIFPNPSTPHYWLPWKFVCYEKMVAWLEFLETHWQGQSYRPCFFFYCSYWLINSIYYLLNDNKLGI